MLVDQIFPLWYHSCRHLPFGSTDLYLCRVLMGKEWGGFGLQTQQIGLILGIAHSYRLQAHRDKCGFQLQEGLFN